MSSTDDSIRSLLAPGSGAIAYWCILASPVAIERVARLGYDFVVLDQQHGDFNETAITTGVQAARAAGAPALVRVLSNEAWAIGGALDRGAAGVIVPQIRSAEDARAAVRASNYPPAGDRSFGLVLAEDLRGLPLAQMNARTICIPMLETVEALEDLEGICAVDGVSAVYVGPSDLRIALGGSRHDDPDVEEVFARALARILEVAHGAGIAVGIHTASGADARARLVQGFDFASVASDANHLVLAAAGHLADARDQGAG